MGWASSCGGRNGSPALHQLEAGAPYYLPPMLSPIYHHHAAKHIFPVPHPPPMSHPPAPGPPRPHAGPPPAAPTAAAPAPGCAPPPPPRPPPRGAPAGRRSPVRRRPPRRCLCAMGVGEERGGGKRGRAVLWSSLYAARWSMLQISTSGRIMWVTENSKGICT